jgi:hypothetical protein
MPGEGNRHEAFINRAKWLPLPNNDQMSFVKIIFLMPRKFLSRSTPSYQNKLNSLLARASILEACCSVKLTLMPETVFGTAAQMTNAC